jgi:hypothetical protein
MDFYEVYLCKKWSADFRRAELRFPWLRIVTPDVLLKEYP